MASPMAVEGEASVPPSDRHEPVLLVETLNWLSPEPGQTLVDATLGLGGHAAAILERVGTEGRVLGIDRDPVALEQATRRLSSGPGRFEAIRGNHRDLVELLSARGIDRVDGIVFDLGVSSMQLDTAERGFSFRFDGPLDMRMDPDSPTTAADLIAELSEEQLRRILWSYGEERRARAIARAVVRERQDNALERTGQLVRLVERVAGPAARRQRIHPATRTFQALRIAVNEEIDELGRTLEDAVSLLPSGGRLAVISFHSLEDRAVKRTLRSLASRCTCPSGLPLCGCGREDLVRLPGRKAVRPTEAETQRNPRARSARLRLAEKL